MQVEYLTLVCMHLIEARIMQMTHYTYHLNLCEVGIPK